MSRLYLKEAEKWERIDTWHTPFYRLKFINVWIFPSGAFSDMLIFCLELNGIHLFSMCCYGTSWRIFLYDKNMFMSSSKQCLLSITCIAAGVKQKDDINFNDYVLHPRRTKIIRRKNWERKYERTCNAQKAGKVLRNYGLFSHWK